MSQLPLQLPVLQNWSCHNCGGCCRQHAIEITAEEKLRIEQQNWSGEPGFQQGEPIFEWHSGPPWNKRYKLAHRADGACVFLNEQGLCRIHAKFGEPAKPLACRIYPYAFHPGGKAVNVGLRFSCPSIVANLGKKLTESRNEIKELQRLVVPESAEFSPPPLITAKERLDWRDTHQFVRALADTIAREDLPLRHRILQSFIWVHLVDLSKFDKLQGARLAEFLHLITSSALDEATEYLAGKELEPTQIGQTPFRQLVSQYARRDTAVELREGLAGRWRLLRAAVIFARGKGLTPSLQPGLDSVPFEKIAGWQQPTPDGVDELLTRYLRVKIQSMHFCGGAFYDWPFTEGYYALAFVLPVMIWIARWLAASACREEWTLEDLQRAMTIVDHHHGYSPIVGSWGFRRRIALFRKTGDLIRIPMWYLQ